MAIEHGDMRAAGIDPDIERVAAFFHAGGQAEACGDFRVAVFEPEIGAFGFDEVGDLQGELGGEDGLAVFVEEHRQRHAPGALARDAPVGPRFDGAVDAVAAPGGQPLDLVDLLERLAAQGRRAR